MTDWTRYGPWALIAGASEGIGEHAARQLADDGFSLALVSRRLEALEGLRESILIETQGRDTQIRCIALDLAADGAARELAGSLEDVDVGLLFYNAGADTGPVRFHDRSLDEVLAMVRRNVVTPTALCHVLGNAMRARGRGGIVVIGSMSGVSGAALVSTYAATKAYQQILAEGLWRELGDDGVDVVSVIAGATATPAHHRTGAVASDRYPQMDPADVARAALHSLGNGPVRGASDELSATFDALRALPREQVIDLMSEGTRTVYGLGS